LNYQKDVFNSAALTELLEFSQIEEPIEFSINLCKIVASRKCDYCNGFERLKTFKPPIIHSNKIEDFYSYAFL